MFYFEQCLWRDLQREELASRYNTEAFALTVKRLFTLAFVPEVDVIPAYEELLALKEYAELDDFIDYFENNFVGSQRRSRRSQPRFSVATWSQYEVSMVLLAATIPLKDGTMRLITALGLHILPLPN